jgi:hypothetical protein
MGFTTLSKFLIHYIMNKLLRTAWHSSSDCETGCRANDTSHSKFIVSNSVTTHEIRETASAAQKSIEPPSLMTATTDRKCVLLFQCNTFPIQSFIKIC